MNLLVVKSVGGLSAENIANGGEGWISLGIVLTDTILDGIDEKETRQTLNEMWRSGILEVDEANRMRFQRKKQKRENNE
jgi:hypothetical protein